eukprot:CAMPEP_0194500056 /NCGR_PEP_ID=MMETSP0253-20130528/16151_1 /TAXON_ID=2966 /ORGANISM="Noctiluca scintillans" /LENGTH=481 /DNA_ID=CAMNT_0039341867 /DNA_START=43 /DNA_END=1488 /DNA_ORIENTATION=-
MTCFATTTCVLSLVAPSIVMALQVAAPELSPQGHLFSEHGNETRGTNSTLQLVQSNGVRDLPCVPNVLSLGLGLSLTLCIMSITAIISLLLASSAPTVAFEQSSKDTSAAEQLESETGAERQGGGAKVKGGQKDLVLSLDGLKVTFIVLVILGHQGFFDNGEQMWRLVHSSMTFFILVSGFMRMGSAQRVSDFASFGPYVARTVVRLCPNYYLAVLLTLFVGYATQRHVSVALPLDAMMIQSLFPLTACHGEGGVVFLPFQGLTVGWFISVIFWCSMLAPLLCRLPRGLWKSSALVVVLLGARAVSEVFGFDGRYVFFPFRLLQFTAGIVCAQLTRDLPSRTREWSGWGSAFDIALLVQVLMALDVLQPASNAIALLMVFVSDLDWCFLIMAAVFASQSRGCAPGIFNRVLGSPPLLWLAPYSFGAFLYQYIPFVVMRIVAGGQFPKYRFVPLVLPWFMGALSEHLLDEPLRRMMESRLRP